MMRSLSSAVALFVVVVDGFVTCTSRLPTTALRAAAAAAPAASEAATSAAKHTLPPLIEKIRGVLTAPLTPREIGILGAIGLYILVRIIIRFTKRRNRFDELEDKFSKMQSQIQSLQDGLGKASSSDSNWDKVTPLKKGKDGTWRPK